MPTINCAGRGVEMNPEGFLLDSSQWTPELAEALACDSGVTRLNERHWKVLSFCREDAAREGRTPGLRRIARLSGVGMEELHRLFPGRPGELAARISGLPQPTDHA